MNVPAVYRQVIFLADTEEFGFYSDISCTNTIDELRNMGSSKCLLYIYYDY